MKINLSQYSPRKSFYKWADALIAEFAKAHDIKMSGAVKGYCATPAGAKTLARWANTEGYKIRYWCIEPYVQESAYGSSKNTIYLGFGLEVDETCHRVAELKLKS